MSLSWEKYATKQQAMQREAAIKQFSRQEKLQLLSEEGRKVVQEVAHNGHKFYFCSFWLLSLIVPRIICSCHQNYFEKGL